MPRSRYFEGKLLGEDDSSAEQEYLHKKCCHGEAEVILDVVFEDGLLFLTVANTGDRPAYRVRVRFDQRFRGLGGTKRMDALTLFRRLEFLAPRKEIRAFLDRSASYFARGEPTKLSAQVVWRTADGKRRSQVIRHDLDVYRDLAYIQREVPDGAGSP